MNRRYFLITCSILPLLAVPNRSNGFIFPVLQFVFVTIAAAVITKLTYIAVEKWVKTSDIGMHAPSIAEVSENVAQQIQQHQCKALLVKSNKDNRVGIIGSQSISSNLTLLIEDLNSKNEDFNEAYWLTLESAGSMYDAHIGELPFE